MIPPYRKPEPPEQWSVAVVVLGSALAIAAILSLLHVELEPIHAPPNLIGTPRSDAAP